MFELLEALDYDVYFPRSFVYGGQPLGRDEFREAHEYPFLAFNFIACARDRALGPVPGAQRTNVASCMILRRYFCAPSAPTCLAFRHTFHSWLCGRKLNPMNVYKYDKRSGIWNLERSWDGEPPPEWLAAHRAEQPSEVYVVAKYAPRGAPKAPKPSHA